MADENQHMEQKYDQLMEFLWGTWDTVDLAQKIQELFPSISVTYATALAGDLADLHHGGSYDREDIVSAIAVIDTMCK